MPLSEEEQRILHEMEQKLREHDREFVDRVSHVSYRFHGSRRAKWGAFGFVAGTLILLLTFRSSIALGIFGVLIMTFSALTFAQGVGQGSDRHAVKGAEPSGQQQAAGSRHAAKPLRSTGIAEEWSEMRRRMRSRFGHRD